MANPWTSAFPQRPGTPQSGVVQSDDEFNQDWRYQVDQTPRYLYDRAELNPSMPTYDAGNASNYWQSLQPIPFGTPTGNPGNYLPTGPEGDHITNQLPEGSSVGEYNKRLNPEYDKVIAAQAAATAQRGENQIRQQQAFDTGMMGSGAIGGVMPSNYSDPTYGQITGQKAGGLGGLGGVDLTGIDNTQQTGAYMGGAGAYNPSPWASNTFQNKNPWSGF
jgi:hypothetical protein